MSATVQLISIAGGSGVLMLAAATHVGAALGRHEADLQHAADQAAAARRRTAARERARRGRPAWPAEYAPPSSPASTPARPVRDETVPLTAVRPGPPGSGRHRKG
ncbi:hypothetical protein [Streptomyces sp. NPDC047070]|uniref:hypothetical protein n=1 Tax=Streptomyces sp. NPDC047070 TaxID=3154923 RepID=UPI003451D40F